MKTSVRIVVLFAACAAQTQTLKLIPVRPDGTVQIPKGIEFLRTHNYHGQPCLNDASALRKALASYSLDQLGHWSFVVVPADDW